MPPASKRARMVSCAAKKEGTVYEGLLMGNKEHDFSQLQMPKNRSYAHFGQIRAFELCNYLSK
jgi:hypothetical protein